MTEPAVTLTDYGLALEATAFLLLLQSGSRRAGGLQFWFSVFFASVSFASLFGGTVHGFFLGPPTFAHAALWKTTLLAIGLTALSTWAIGALLLFSQRAARGVIAFAAVQYAVYSYVVLFRTSEFRVAVVITLPAALFLLVALGVAYWRDRRPGSPSAAAGVLVSLVAGILQQRGVGFGSEALNHNVLYHVLQAIVLYLLYRGGRTLIAHNRLPAAPQKDRSTFSARPGGP
jgi:hypothetical protein